MGYQSFMNDIDAILMGRKTFEIVLNFDGPWPYEVPVFVLSQTLKSVPSNLVGRVFLLSGTLAEVLKQIHQKGYDRLYIDGGKTIQSFLKEDRIDELIITVMPILLGGGDALFANLPHELTFDLVESKTYLNQVSQNHYRRKRGT